MTLHREALVRLAFGLLFGASFSSWAQAPATPALAPATAGKKELIQKLVVLQQGAIEQAARDLVERPARQMLQGSEVALRERVAADKREEAKKAVEQALRKYLDEVYPLMHERVLKLGASTLAPAIDEKFTEDELRQIVGFLESPANKKMQQTLPELSSTVLQKLVTDSKPTIEPKIKALDAAVAAALGLPPAGAASSAKATAPKKAASAAKP